MNLAKVRSAIGLTIALGALIALPVAVLLALRLAGCGFHGDPEAVLSTSGRRLWEIGARRGSVLGVVLLAWLAAFAAALLATRGRAGRGGVRLAALSLVYLPLACLVGAALEPGIGAERLLLGLGSPALALVTLAALDGCRALAVACATTTLAFTVDAIAGSPLSRLSLVGPNPAGGHRFYGIGNELEAILAVLVLAGTGAALSGFAPRLDRRRAAAAFLAAAVPLAFVFAYGAYGADVGAAIVLPLGATVATALVAGRRRLALLAFALPLPAVALLAAADLLSGARTHLTAAILGSEGSGGTLAVVGHRLRETGESFGRPVLLPGLPAVAAAALLAWAWRARLAVWLTDHAALRAGLGGALAAILVGTLANDSGALLLEIGGLYLVAFAAFAWAEAPGAGKPPGCREGDPRRSARAIDYA